MKGSSFKNSTDLVCFCLQGTPGARWVMWLSQEAAAYVLFQFLQSPVQALRCQQPLAGGTECSQMAQGIKRLILANSFWSAKKAKPDWWSLDLEFWLQMLYSPFGFSQTYQRGADL